MANKLRNWRPDEGFYKIIRERFPEEWSDHEVVQALAASYLSQSVTHSNLSVTDTSVTHTNQSESLTELRVLELIGNALNEIQPMDEEDVKNMINASTVKFSLTEEAMQEMVSTAIANAAPGLSENDILEMLDVRDKGTVEFREKMELMYEFLLDSAAFRSKFDAFCKEKAKEDEIVSEPHPGFEN